MKPLKERLSDREDALDAIVTDVRTYGLLVKDHSKANALKFPHKSFFEYLFAEFVARNISDQDRVVCNAIRAATNVSIESIIDMPESLAFAGELIYSKQEASSSRLRLLDELFDRVVLPRSIGLPIFLKKVFLLELVLRVAKSHYRFLHPSLLLTVTGTMACSMLAFMYVTELKPVNSSIVVLGFVAGVAFALSNSLLSFFVSRRRVVLWACIVKNLGFAQQDVSQVYGSLVARELPHLVSRTVAGDIEAENFFPPGRVEARQQK